MSEKHIHDGEIPEGFCKREEESLRGLYLSLDLAMTFADFVCIQRYFREEGRDPSLTEIRVLDAVWTDRCRPAGNEGPFADGENREEREDEKDGRARPGDIVLLIGEETAGPAVSSRTHGPVSPEACGRKGQEGKTPTEGKMQRLFSRPEFLRGVRRCSDVADGGMAAAVGELAEGIWIDLNTVRIMEPDLDGTEAALWAPGGCRAVVIDPEDLPAMMQNIREENLDAAVVAEVTEEPRLVILWQDRVIVDLSRTLLQAHGARTQTYFQ